MSPPGIKPVTLCFPAFHSNHSAIGTVNDMLLKLLQYFFYETIPQELCAVSKEYIENKKIRTLFTYSFVIDII